MFTISKKAQGGVELYVNRLYKGFLDRSRFFCSDVLSYRFSIINALFFSTLAVVVFFFGGGAHTEQQSIIFMQH